MRYFIGFLIVIGLIVLVFVLFLTGGTSTPKKLPKSLTSYSNTDTVMQLTIDGPVYADVNHRSIQITIGRSDATMNIIQGYQDTVINHVSYVNNPDAYKVFLRAIDLQGFSKTRNTSNTDDTGVCPQGSRYIYEIINGATDVQRIWNASCAGNGTFGGNTTTLLTLFQRQIPDYVKLTQNISLGSSGSF